jgi:Ca2+-binding EF-hand superfamily protein
MGNTLHSHDNLIYLRGWTAAEVDEVQRLLRRGRPAMLLDKVRFMQVLGHKDSEMTRLFDDMDTDFDGKVDTFEALVTLILYSNCNWDDKQDFLFRLFDFNGKGVLRSKELLFLASTVVHVLQKFARLNPRYEDFRALSEVTNVAFAGSTSTATAELGFDAFKIWFESCEFTQDLKKFVDDNAAQHIPESMENPMRKKVRMLEYKAREMGTMLQQLREKVATIDGESPEREPQQQRRYDSLRQNLEVHIAKLQKASETQHDELQELAATLNDEFQKSGLPGLVDPKKRIRHDQLITEIETIQAQSQNDYTSAVDLIGALIELTYGLEPAPAARASTDAGRLSAQQGPGDSIGQPLSLAIPAVDDEEVTAMRQRLLNRDFKKKAMKRKAESTISGTSAPTPATHTYGASAGPGAAPPQMDAATAASQAAAAAPLITDADEEYQEGEQLTVVVAFADFDPPPSHETAMLALKAGDDIIVTGRDDQGWWYGRKRDNTEGWFPPSYVQLKDE